jgi:hypothetical protein
MSKAISGISLAARIPHVAMAHKRALGSGGDFCGICVTLPEKVHFIQRQSQHLPNLMGGNASDPA